MPPARWTELQSLVSRSKSTWPVPRTMMEVVEVEVTAREEVVVASAVEVETINNPVAEEVVDVVDVVVEVVDMVAVDMAMVEEDTAAMDTMEVMGVEGTTEIMEDTE